MTPKQNIEKTRQMISKVFNHMNDYEFDQIDSEDNLGYILDHFASLIDPNKTNTDPVLKGLFDTHKTFCLGLKYINNNWKHGQPNSNISVRTKPFTIGKSRTGSTDTIGGGTLVWAIQPTNSPITGCAEITAYNDLFNDKSVLESLKTLDKYLANLY